MIAKNKIVLISYFFLGISLISAQDKPKADSIKEILTSCLDKQEKYGLLIKIARCDTPIEGLGYSFQALDIAKDLKDYSKIALAYEYIGLCQRRLGNNPEAIEASLKALRLYEKLGEFDKKAKMNLQIGSHFINNKDYNEGVHYIREALKVFEIQKDSVNVAYALINLGETFRLMQLYDSAVFCFNECLEMNKYLKSDLVQGYALGNLGLVLSNINKYTKGKPELEKAIELLRPLGDVSSVTVYQCGLSRICIQEGESVLGEKLMLECLEMAKDEKLKEQISNISYELAVFYEEKKAFKKAIQYRKLYEVYHDSLVNIENVRKIQQLHSSFLLEKKDSDIQYLERENRIRKRRILVLIIGILIFSVLTVFLFIVIKQRKSALNEVVEQKKVIEKREQEKGLLLKELNHRVKNNLQMVSGLINIKIQQSKDAIAVKALRETRNRIEALMLIHSKLYSNQDDMMVDLDVYFKELVNNIIYGSPQKIQLKCLCEPIRVHVDSAITLGIILNELITNSLKYVSNLKDAIVLSVSLIHSDSKITINVSDNGPGIPSTKGQGRAETMGLRLVHSLVRQLQGEINYQFQKGCSWTIILNFNNLNK